jgi:hypothetical protein
MSEEEDLVGTDIDRAIRAAMMSAGQVAEAVKRVGQERDRGLAERAQAAVREQAQVTRSVLDQVGRDAFWAAANGERIANAATYGATLSNVDPGARDVYEIVREQAHQRYGIDVDSLRAQFPDSEDRRRDALMNAVDDYLAASREEKAAETDRARAAELEQESAQPQEQETRPGVAERDGDVDRGELSSAGDEHEEAAPRWAVDGADGARDAGPEYDHSTGVSTQEAYADAGAHEASRDRLHTDGVLKESAVRMHEQETGRVAAAPVTAAGRASKIASTSYPHDANETLTLSRKVAQPRARVNRGGSAQKERVQGLER